MKLGRIAALKIQQNLIDSGYIVSVKKLEDGSYDIMGRFIPATPIEPTRGLSLSIFHNVVWRCSPDGYSKLIGLNFDKT